MPEEFIDGDIDRSEFDKYLSGYGANHATSVNCSFYGGVGNVGLSHAGGTNNLSDGQSTSEQFDGHKENGAGLHANEYILMKSEPIYETIPAAGSSLSSALADVRSVYYDCWAILFYSCLFYLHESSTNKKTLQKTNKQKKKTKQKQKHLPFLVTLYHTSSSAQ